MDLDFSVPATTDGQAANGEPIALALLALINQARSEHGMRQQDFHRYRQFCAKKVHRLRETLDKTHTSDGAGKSAAAKKSKQGKKGLSKKAKRTAQSATVQSEQSKGTGNVFVRQSINVAAMQSDRPAQLVLFEAERAWAYSQELKQQAFDKEQDAKLRKHGLARARRAVQWSAQLLKMLHALGSERIDLLGLAEAEAYHVLLRGYEAFDADKHADSIEFLSVARKLFYLVADASSDSRNEALANSFVDGTDAMLRFCAYNLDIGEQDMDKLTEAVATPQVCQKSVEGYEALAEKLKEKASQNNARQSKDSRLDEIEWRGKRIPIRNPDLVEVVTKVRDAEERLRSTSKSKGESSQAKSNAGREHKRQRLTSAQRSAKRRGQLTAASAATDATAESSAQSTSKAVTGSKTELDGYDALLAALTEAEGIAQTLVRDNAEALSKSHSGRYEATGTNLINAHEYLLFKLLAARIERNHALMDELNEKSEKRRARAREHVQDRIKALDKSKKSRSSTKEPVRRRVKPSPKKVRPANRSRKTAANKKKSSGLAVDKSQARKKPSSRKQAAEERLRQRGELKVRRIVARIIPGLARLLDANEMSCGGISGLNLVESDSNLSTLIEAKSAWFKAELLRLLARSFAWSEESSKALVLLNRADLFVREAKNAMELVEADEVVDEDTQLLPPQMSEATFDKTTEEIAALRLQIQREVYARQTGAASASSSLKRVSGAQSKAAQAVRDLASKYVEFDPIDLQQAAVIPLELEDRFEAELSAGAPASRRPSAIPAAKAAPVQPSKPVAAELPASKVDVQQPEAVSAVLEEDEVVAEGPYDPANAEDEEEELQTAAAGQRKWLGGWFGRG